MDYRHRIDGAEVDLPIGKVVCVGRNYAAHARELNNPVPSEPVLFIKPNTSIASLADPVAIPAHLGQCHFETEMSILICEELAAGCDEQQAQGARCVTIDTEGRLELARFRSYQHKTNMCDTRTNERSDGHPDRRQERYNHIHGHGYER